MLLAQSNVIALVCLMFLGSMAQAEEQQATQAIQNIKLKPGFSRLLKFDRPVFRAIVGDDVVADVNAEIEGTVVITAKKIGQTNLIVVDNDKNEFFHATITVGGQNVDKVEIHTWDRRLLHNYFAYACTPVCERVKDELESISSVPGFPRRTESTEAVTTTRPLGPGEGAETTTRSDTTTR
jgi:hypothetical protein